MRSIALFLPNWIGDVVMATPAIRAVRERFPAARIIAVCKPYVAETIAGSPWFNGLVLLETGKLWTAVKQLRTEKIEAAALFPNSFRSALIAKLAGIPAVVGFARYGRDALLTRRLYPERDSSGKPKPVPILAEYNRIVQLLGTGEPGHRMELFTTSTDESQAETEWNRLGLQKYSNVVGLNPGGAFGASKHWPHFVELARALREKGHGVVVLCGPAERETARTISTHSGTVSLADSLHSIGLTKAIVRRLQMLVTTDSGPRHFAAAFNIPVITLFGPTHIAWTETWFDKSIHLQKPVPCGPCQQRTCPLGHHRCMVELTPGEVLAEVNRLFLRFTDVRSEYRHAG